MITVETLVEMTKCLPGLKLFVKWTPMTWDDDVVKALEYIAGDEELLQILADWLNYLPLFKGAADAGFETDNPEPAFPSRCEPVRPGLEQWREYLHRNRSLA